MVTTAHNHPADTGLITHATAVIVGTVDADVSVYHARHTHARIAIVWGGVLVTLFSAAAAQGLLEGFGAARQCSARLPRQLPAPGVAEGGFARSIVAMEFTYRPTYVVVPQSGTAGTPERAVHWVDLHTGPITWQIRDHIGLRSAIALLKHVHKTAAAVFLDGPAHGEDPLVDHYRGPN